MPKDGCNDSITTATGVKWNVLLPILTYLGLITFTITSVVNPANVMRQQWEEFANSLMGQIRIEISEMFINKQRTYYICIGNPKYNNVTLQQRSNREEPMVLRREQEERQELHCDAQIIATQIVAKRQYDRVIYPDSNKVQNNQMVQQQQINSNRNLNNINNCPFLYVKTLL